MAHILDALFVCDERFFTWYEYRCLINLYFQNSLSPSDTTGVSAKQGESIRCHISGYHLPSHVCFLSCKFRSAGELGSKSRTTQTCMGKKSFLFTIRHPLESIILRWELSAPKLFENNRPMAPKQHKTKFIYRPFWYLNATVWASWFWNSNDHIS